MATKTVKKNKKNKSVSNNVPVFRINALTKEYAQCKIVGSIEPKDKIYDEALDINDKNIHVLYDIDSYGVAVMAKRCNIVADYLLQNDKLPIYYTTIIYDKTLVSGYLLTIYLYFTISKETKEQLDQPKKYVNKRMTGTYTLEVVGDEGLLGNIIEIKRPEIKEQLFEKYMNEFDNCTNEEDKTKLFNKIDVEEENELDKYRKIFEPKTVYESPYKNRIINKMMDIINTDIFKDIIKTSLKIREKERIERLSPENDLFIKKPKKTINLKELKENPEDIDKIVDDLVDNASNYYSSDSDE